MPDLEQVKKSQVATDVATQAPTTAAPTAKESMRKQAGAVSFAEGEAMLKPEKAPVPGDKTDEKKKAEDAAAKKKKEEARVAAAKKSYEQALGKFLGGKLFDLIHKELGPDKLLGYGKDGVKAMGSVTDAIKPTDKGAAGGIMDEASEAAAAKALADALVKWTQGEAVKWLESDDGKALLTKINNWVEGHPRTIALSLVAAALSAATIAYVSNVSLADLKTDFDIAKGLKGNVAVDLGKIQDIALNAAEIGLAYSANGVTASASGSYKKTDDGDVYGVKAAAGLEKGGHKANVSGEYSTDGKQKYGASYQYAASKDKGALQIGTQGDATVDKDGNLVVGAKGSLAKGKFSADVGTSRSSNKDGEVTAQKTNATVKYGDKNDLHQVDGTYDHTKDEFTLSTSRTRMFEGDGYKLGLKESYKPEGKTTDITATSTPSKSTSLSMGVNATGDKVNSANMGVKYSNEWLKAQLDLQMKDGKSTLSTSATATKNNWSASANAKLNIDDGRLTELGVKLGYKDPNAFRTYLLEYKRSWIAENEQYADRFDLMLEESLGKVAFRVQGTVGLQGGNLQNAGVKGLAAYPLTSDLKLLGGAGYDYQAAGVTGDRGLNQGNGATIYGGVQFKDVPITVGYRPKDNAWTIGLQIKF